MDRTMLLLLGIAIAVLLFLALGWIVWSTMNRRRARALHERFGPEYDAARTQYGKLADKKLEERVKRVESFNLRPLDPKESEAFAASWWSVQARFVEDPPLAIAEANRLVKDVMEACGYPMADFDQRAADISVDHPRVVEDYRAARAIAARSRTKQASTEELRKAMIHYKALFQELLGSAAIPPQLHEVSR